MIYSHFHPYLKIRDEVSSVIELHKAMNAICRGCFCFSCCCFEVLLSDFVFCLLRSIEIRLKIFSTLDGLSQQQLLKLKRA